MTVPAPIPDPLQSVGNYLNQLATWLGAILPQKPTFLIMNVALGTDKIVALAAEQVKIVDAIQAVRTHCRERIWWYWAQIVASVKQSREFGASAKLLDQVESVAKTAINLATLMLDRGANSTTRQDRNRAWGKFEKLRDRVVLARGITSAPKNIFTQESFSVSTRPKATLWANARWITKNCAVTSDDIRTRRKTIKDIRSRQGRRNNNPEYYLPDVERAFPNKAPSLVKKFIAQKA